MKTTPVNFAQLEAARDYINQHGPPALIREVTEQIAAKETLAHEMYRAGGEIDAELIAEIARLRLYKDFAYTEFARSFPAEQLGIIGERT